MIIKELQLNNFVCYVGKDELPIVIEFSKGVNIFSASNGGGKSQLFNAFYWVLFNEIYITNKGWEKGYPTSFIPDILKSKCGNSDKISISVKLKLENDPITPNSSPVDYTFFRSIEFIKKENLFEICKPSELEISFLDEAFQTQYVKSLDIENTINTILPERVRKYMWFQGETIDDLIDFNNSGTLNTAIEALSYYPYYRELHRIAQITNKTLSDRINESIKLNRTLSERETSLLREIAIVQGNIENVQKDREEIKKNIDKAKESVFEFTNKLSAYSDFPNIEKRIKVIEEEDEKVKREIENLELDSKNKIITTWMLKGTVDIIKESEKYINSLGQTIKEQSKSKNPIPLKVPGNTYIQQMLDDEFCYICERKALKNSEEYNAIQNRLDENSSVESEYKEAIKKQVYPENSFVELANIPNQILPIIKNISTRISDYRSEMASLLQKRRNNQTLKKKIYDELNISDSDLTKIKEASVTAKDLTQKLIFYKDELTRYQNKSTILKENEEGHLEKLKALKVKRIELKKKGEKKSEFEEAEPYATLLEKITKELKENAYEKLIFEIEKESNNLYQEYLKANTTSKGRIVIDRDNSSVGIEDNGSLIVLSQGLTTAAKMSVINAILSLSANKIGKNYPLIADAPSSVFSSENTQTYTKKIGETFKQVIIMSKDYSIDELSKLKNENHISKIWQLENKKIDEKSTDESRANFKTFISEFKK